MGFISQIFSGLGKGISSGIVSGKNPGKGWVEANRFNKAKGGYAGGYGAITFGNIIRAHGDEEEIVEEFGLDQPECIYDHPHFGMNCYMYAYNEALEQAVAMSIIMGGMVDPEELIDEEQVEEDAHEYALELAGMYINGEIWIPYEILHWAYYDVSDHNN